jgi:hypothetical protein
MVLTNSPELAIKFAGRTATLYKGIVLTSGDESELRLTLFPLRSVCLAMSYPLPNLWSRFQNRDTTQRSWWPRYGATARFG